MGCFSPVPGAPDLVDSLLRPVVEELAAAGAPFVGCLYGGVILTDEGPRILEYNCRFGDPEAQVILPRLDGDLLPALVAAASGDLGGATLSEGSDAAVAVGAGRGHVPGEGRQRHADRRNEDAKPTAHSSSCRHGPRTAAWSRTAAAS